jgi:opacity protein-like surface antigen
MRRLLAVVGVVLAIFAAPAFSATKTGDNELTLSGAFAFTSYEDFDVTSFTVQTSYSRFLTDAISVGGALAGTWMDVEGDTATAAAIDVNAKWHFNTSAELVPYIGPQVGLIMVDSEGYSDSVFSYGAFAGVKYFAKENVFVFAEYNFKMYSLDEGGGDIMVNALLFGVGFVF